MCVPNSHLTILKFIVGNVVYLSPAEQFEQNIGIGENFSSSAFTDNQIGRPHLDENRVRTPRRDRLRLSHIFPKGF